MVDVTQVEPLRFTLQVRLTHPSISPESISRALGREADRMWKAGEVRRTPVGQSLPGSYKHTYWSYSKRVAGERSFLDAVTKAVHELGEKVEFFRDFHDTGGETTLIVGLPGDINIGDVVSAQDLRTISEAGFGLGIEVFPNLP